MNIICYLSNGYPTNEKTLENADNYVAGGCDIIEVDLPTNNPFLDNEFIQGRMKHSYAQDKTLQSQVDNLLKIREKYPEQKILLLVYEYTVKEMGLEVFVKIAQKICPEAVILVGSEDNTVTQYLKIHGIEVAHFIPFDLPDSEIEKAKNSTSFIYLQAKPTGSVRANLDTLKKVIAYLRTEKGLNQPIYCGMGISTQEDIEMLADAGAEGAFIGSSVLKLTDRSDVIDYIKKLKEVSI